MKKITFFLLLILSTYFTVANAQQDHLARAKGNNLSQTSNKGPSLAVGTIYNTTHASNQGVEINAAANGGNTGMGDAVVVAGTEKYLTSLTVDVFNLSSAANYNLSLSLFSDCPSNGLANSSCGSGPGVQIGSTITQNVTPGPLGFLYTVTFNIPYIDISSETDNNITVVLNASRNDVYWVIGETVTVGAQPVGEPPTSFVVRCGSVPNNNGCARNFGLQNNFAMTIMADSSLPPMPPVNDLCANAITIMSDGLINGTTTNATMDTAPTCVTSVGAPGVWYVFTDTTGTGSTVDLDLCSGTATYDTKLSVYTGSCGTFTCVTGNDDSCGVQSAVQFTTDGSSTYYVLVHGFGGETGDFDLNVSGLPITIVGNAPVIACPMDILTDSDPGVCTANVNFANAIAIDVEDGVLTTTQTLGPPSGSAFPLGDTLIQFSVTDSDGNTVTCQFTITVVDNEAPIATCQNLTIDLDPVTGTVSITGEDVDNGSTDNCGIASYTLDVSSFDCSNIGDNTVTLTVTDNSGNESTCVSTVTVQDVTAPEIVCIGGFGTFTETEDFEAATIPVGWTTTIEAGVQDWTFGSGDLPTGDDFPTNAAIFDDDAAGSGQTNAATLISPVYDLTGASNVILGYDVAFQESGDQTFTVEVFDGSAWQQVAFYDADLDPDIQTESFDVSAYANPAFQVRYVFDDLGGWGWAAAIDNFSLSYEASTGEGLDVFLDANGMATVNASDLVVSVNEVCGYIVTTAGVPPVAGNIQTLFNSNNGGNPGGAIYFDITVGENDINISDIDVNTGEAGAFTMNVYTLVGSYVPNLGNATAWGTPISAAGTSAGIDAPSNAVLASTLTLSAGTTYGMAIVLDGSHAHAYSGTGSDPAPGETSYSNDDLSLALGSASNVPFDGAAFTPRIFNGNIHYTVGTAPMATIDFDCSNLGENLIDIMVTDDSGNTAMCTAIVNVIDNTPPVLVCQDTTIELGPDGTTTIDPMALLATMPTTYEVMVIGSDNQSLAEGFTDFTVNITEAASITFDWDYTSNDDPGFDSFGYILNGTYTQLTNPSQGNQSGNASVSVSPGDVFGFRSQTDDNFLGNNETVISNFMPGFTGQFDPANWTLSLTNSDGDAFFVEIPGGPLSFDACGITVLAVDVTEVSCADIGTPITITVFASDASGNIAACTSIVTVVDNLAPVITCPADQTVDPGVGNLFYILPDYFATGEGTANDNCTDPVTITSQDPAPGTALSDGTYTVTLTAEDEYGNVSTCNFELIVLSVLGVNDNSLEAGVTLYPNPANSLVNLVNRTNISLEQMVIFDIHGKQVNKIDLRGMQSEKAIDVSSLSAGVYVIQIIGDKSSTVKRLIKE